MAWLSWDDMLPLRWKDSKDVFLRITIHAPPEVPDWVRAASDEEEGMDDECEGAVRRRVKRGEPVAYCQGVPAKSGPTLQPFHGWCRCL